MNITTSKKGHEPRENGARPPVRLLGFKMKSTLRFVFLATTSASLSSCLCGIFRNEYVPAKKQVHLSDQLVTRVAAANGFSPKPPEHSRTRFAREDVELLYEDGGQVLVLRSSYCPFILFRVDPKPWESRCKEYAGMIEKSFRAIDVPLRELSTDESIARHSNGKPDGGDKRE